MEQQFMVERGQNRIGMRLTAMLIGTHGKLGVEKAVTENVSPGGVRVISTSDWFIDDTILVSLPAGHFTSAARVAYCDVLGQGKFGVGLEFVGSSEALEINALAAALKTPQA
ncbi:MAG: PilZ domain-containing protein [Candidatus Acidiferrales bacterium]